MEISYLAGLVAGDGHIEPNGKIVISNKRKYFLQLVRRIFKLGGSLFYDKSAKVWKLSLYKKSLSKIMNKKYKIPIGKKAEKLEMPNLKTKKEIIFFLGGLFDADGGIEVSHGKYFRIRLRLKSKKMIESVYHVLLKFNFRPRMHNREKQFVVEINRQEEVVRFLSSVPLLLLKAEGPNLPGYTWPTMAETMRCNPERGS
jgi:DNA-binding transcriptional regulator WhiA